MKVGFFSFGLMGTSLDKGLRKLSSIGYGGYISYEFCHPFMPKRHEFSTIADVDENIKAVPAYMSLH